MFALDTATAPPPGEPMPLRVLGALRRWWRRGPAVGLPAWSEASPDTLTSLFQSTLHGAFRTTPEGRLLDCNPALVAMLGYGSREELLATNVHDLYADQQQREPIVSQLGRDGEIHNAELVLRRKDGRALVALENSRAVFGWRGEVVYYEGFLTDVTERHESQLLFRTVANNTPLSLFIIQNGRLVFVNPQFALTSGYQESDLLGRDSLFMVHPEDLRLVRDKAVEMLKGTRTQPYEFRIRTALGQTRWVMGAVTPIEYRGERAALGNFIDISDRKQFEQQLAQRAFYDALTGLPNRTLFVDRLDHALEGAQRRNERVAVMFLDLDGFKLVNDRLGHAAGDQLLADVASRLRGVVRSGDTLARFGGDEFTLLLELVSGEEDATRIAGRIIEVIEESFDFGSQQFQLSTSIGITFSPPRGGDTDELLRQADIALYAAKRGGKGCYVVYQEGMTLQAA